MTADLMPGDAAAQLKAGQLLLLAAKFEDAKTRAEKVLALDSKNVEAQILKGNAAAGLKDLNGAFDDINEAIKLEPKNARAYANLGAIEMQKGRAAEAEAAFKRAVEVDSTSVVAQLALANFYWSAGRLPEAEAPLKRAVELDPTSVIGQRALSTFYMSTGRLKEAEAPLKSLAEKPGDMPGSADPGRLLHQGRALRRSDHDSSNGGPSRPAAYADATLRLAAIDYVQKRPPTRIAGWTKCGPNSPRTRRPPS